MTADGTGTRTQIYQWDGEGRLSTVDSGSTATYTYNALGHPVLANFSSANHELLFDPSGGLLKAPDPAPTVSPDVFLLPVAGRPLGYYLDADYYTVFVHPNHLGSWTTLTFGDGSLQQDGLYYPWGQAWTTFAQQQRFAGLGHHDTETGLDWTLFRRYSSAQGRWLSPDPLGGDITNPQSLNRYAYVLNNPTTFIDQLGLDCSAATKALAPGTPCIDVTSTLSTPTPPPPPSSGPSAEPAILPGQLSDPGGAIGPPNADILEAHLERNADRGDRPGKPPSALRNIPQITWSSLKSPNGCGRLLFGAFANDLNPFPTEPSPTDLAEPASKFLSAVAFTKALSYAAGQPNVLGGIGLLYPFKSGVFRGLVDVSEAFAEAAPEINLAYATRHALYASGRAAYNGECQ